MKEERILDTVEAAVNPSNNISDERKHARITQQKETIIDVPLGVCMLRFNKVYRHPPSIPDKGERFIMRSIRRKKNLEVSVPSMATGDRQSKTGVPASLFPPTLDPERELPTRLAQLGTHMAVFECYESTHLVDFALAEYIVARQIALTTPFKPGTMTEGIYSCLVLLDRAHRSGLRVASASKDASGTGSRITEMPVQAP
ncbi:hypothetical protein EDD17DRAFT_1510506 [Pisolithus thermaeus]|nr:hypothetical protein EV401DRAFT_1889078 [Pisolithus croceorrhizus]KAI6160409.1 hypothetical protein EDD17DRAFT_1510506 [Pisolithus thermaeus]